MAIHADLVSLLSESLPEYLAAAEFCVNSKKDGQENSCLGFPAAHLLLSIADSIGSYYRGNAQFTMMIDGKKRWIKNDGFHHFFILNSKYYEVGLSHELIKTLYDNFRSLLSHNSALMAQHALVYHPDLREPFIVMDSIPHINVCGFLRVSQKAVALFLHDLSKIVPQSHQARIVDQRTKQFFQRYRNP